MSLLRFYTLVLLTLLLFPLFGQSQQNAQLELKQTQKGKDSIYIRDYSNYLMIGMFTSAPFMNLNVNPLTDSLGKYSSSFKGNLSSTIGFSIGYKVLGFSFGFKLPAEPGSGDSLGKTIYKVLSLKIRKRAMTVSFDYRKYKGFYDASTRNFNTSLPSNTPFIIRPDMAVFNYSGSFIMNFFWRKYSYAAPITYCDRQIKTRFGFLLKGDISYMQLSSDSTFISTNQKQAFSDFNQVKAINAMIFKTGPGIGMNIVFFKRMYFSLNLFLMSNNLLYRYKDIDNNNSIYRTNINYFLDGAIGLGYSSKRFYIGIRGGGENNVVRLEGAKIQSSFGTVNFDMGFRFNAPGFLRKGWEKTFTRYLGL